MNANPWPEWPLSALMEFRNGINAEKTAYGAGVPFVNVLEVITKSHLRICDVPGRIGVAPSVALSFSVRRGDVVFNRTSETQEEVGLASVYLDDAEAVFGGFVLRGRPLSSVELDSEYLGYGLRALAVRQQIIARGQGAIRANVGQADLRQVIVSVPPLAEQRAIAAALSDVDALIAALDDLIAKKKDLKTATMQQLLTGQRRLPGFAGAFKTMEIRAVCDMRAGSPIVQEEIGEHEKYRCFGGNGLRGNTGRYTHDGSYVLIGRQGALCGNVVHVTGKFFASEHAIVVDVRRNIDSRWFSFALERMDLNKYTESSAQPGLSVQKLLLLDVDVPPSIEEQNAIAGVLLDQDDEISSLEARRDKTKLLKQGMMQELLTGRTRLVDTK